MLMQVMRANIYVTDKILIDLWDEDTKTNAELRLTIPTSEITELRNYLRFLWRLHIPVDGVKILILQTILQRDHIKLHEAIAKIGDIT